MSYCIDEQDLERQRLLARVLNRFSEIHVVRLAPAAPARCLDIGSGIGETTRMLARMLPRASECTGLDGDPKLLQIARDQPRSGNRVSFQHGLATPLPFEDRSFDFVFTRYLLIHLSDTIEAIREMVRVLKPGGTVLAQEPDFGFQCCYPSSAAFERISELFQSVFPDARIGRKLVHHFRKAGAASPQAFVDMGIEFGGNDARRLYRMSVGAIRSAVLRQGGISEARFDELVDDLRRVEEDPAVVLIGNPIVSVWATV